jgi:hypothetical protein
VSFRLHPRDNILKVCLRHKSLALLRHIHRGVVGGTSGPNLIISSFSSALVTNSMAGDLLLNVDIGHTSEIARHEFRWLPATDLEMIGRCRLALSCFCRD